MQNPVLMLKLLTFRVGTALRPGLLLSENKLLDLSPRVSSTMSVIKSGPSLIAELYESVKHPNEDLVLDLDSVALAAPIVRPPRNIFCVGKNYMDHIQEVANTHDDTKDIVSVPKYPQFFSKVPETVIATNENIPSHSSYTRWLDYEAELAVIIGKEGTNIAASDANDYIFGYSIANDISARDIQKRHVQFMKGKCLDGSCPMGPYILHKDSVQGDMNDARIQCWVNDSLRQDSRTSNMIFSIPEIIHQLSLGMTLFPGDIILTGTPAGVGFAMKPPEVLRSGDNIRVEIEELSSLVNTVK